MQDARVVELVDSLASGASARKGVRVRLPPRAPRRSKVRFAPTSFYARGKKDVIRVLPCSPFPTATRCAKLAVGGPPCGRHVSPLRNIGFIRPFHIGVSVLSLAPMFYALAQFYSAAPSPKPNPPRRVPVWRRLWAAFYRFLL